MVRINNKLYNQAMLSETEAYIKYLNECFNNKTVKIFDIKPNVEFMEDYDLNHYKMLVNYNLLSILMGRFVLRTDELAVEKFTDTGLDYINNIDKYLMQALDVYGQFSVHFKPEYYTGNDEAREKVQEYVIDMTLYLLCIRYILAKTIDTSRYGRNHGMSRSILHNVDSNHLKSYDLVNNFKEQFHEITYSLIAIRSEFPERHIKDQRLFFAKRTSLEFQASISRTISLVENSINFLYQLLYDIDHHYFNDNTEQGVEIFCEKMENLIVKRYDLIMKSLGIEESFKVE